MANVSNVHVVNFATTVVQSGSGLSYDYASGATVPLYSLVHVNSDNAVFTTFKNDAADSYSFPQVLVDGTYEVHALFRFSSVSSPSNFYIQESIVRGAVANPVHAPLAFQNTNAVNDGEVHVNYSYIANLLANDGILYTIVTYGAAQLNIDEIRLIVKKL